MVNLIDHRHISFNFIHDKVPRNLNIDGILNQGPFIPQEDNGMVQNFDTIDSMNNASESPNVNNQVYHGSKSNFEPNFSTLTAVFNEFAQLAVRYGCELVTYGAAIQMKNAIETDGSLTRGN